MGEVPLPSQNGWNAFLVLDNAPTGIWTVEAFDVFAQHGLPEIVGLDDLGRAHICVSYSGKWTPTTVISDGKWLGGLAHGDVDARIAGAEIYTGSLQGNLYQIVAHPNGILDYRLIATLPGREIHTLVAGDVDAGYFNEDHNVETVAIFGYSRKVELLTRTADGWRAEPIFEDLDKGHWLAVAELDGRNNTHEIVASGYGARIVMLSRPPGYGRTESRLEATPNTP